MSENQEVAVMRPTQEIITARFNKELTKLSFQEALNGLSKFEVTPDSIPAAQLKLKGARAFITKMKEIHAQGKADAWSECKMWDKALTDLTKPLNDVLAAKDAEVQKVAQKAAEDAEKLRRENLRVDNIKKSIDAFIFEQTNAIVSAKTPEAIISIEKLIGSHKANSSRYAEFLPILIERVNELTPLLKNQKEHIKELEEINKQKAAALIEGDDAKVLELQDQQEAVSDKIEETKVIIQETAISGAIQPADVISLPTTVFAPKPRRSQWTYEVVDEKKAFAAGMLVCEINKEKAKEKLEDIKKNTPEGKEETIIDGVRYFLQKTF